MIAALASQARRWRARDARRVVPGRAADHDPAGRARLGRATACCSQFIHDLQLFHERPHPVGASLPEDLLAFFGLLALGAGLGRMISINQFSLHGMYRSRLVRTFLGASRAKGRPPPSAFTGFDAADDMPFERLAHARPSAARRQHAR